MISFIVGNNGSGKSLYAVWLMRQFCLQGQTVYTNIELLPAHPNFDDIHFLESDQVYNPKTKEMFFDFMQPGAVAILDEAAVYFDCDDRKSLKRLNDYINQHRKRDLWGHNLFFVQQRLASMFNRVRDIGSEYIYCLNESDRCPLGGADWMTRTVWSCWPDVLKRYRRYVYSSKAMRHEDLVETGSFTKAEAAVMYPWYRTDAISARVLEKLNDQKYVAQLPATGHFHSGPTFLDGDADSEPGEAA